MSKDLREQTSSLNRQQKTVLLGSWMGWSLDGYDLVLMLFVIPSVNQLFFPSENPTLSLIATFATYVVTLVMRPVGGAIFGNFGDKYGRKNAMLITITGFSAVTFLTGLLPTFQTVGILAPLLLILLRLTQGIFAGGEWASGAVLMMETAPKAMRGLLSGLLQSGFPFGFLLASIAFELMSSTYPADAFAEMGWRVLFFTGVIPGLVALFVRFKMGESELWLQKSRARQIEKAPLRKVLESREARKRFFQALVVMTGLMYSYYTSIGFLPTFLQDYLLLGRSEIGILMIAATISSMLGHIFAGFVSQYIGRMNTLTLFSMAAIIVAIPVLSALFNSTTTSERMLYVAALVATASTAFGAIPAFLSERFHTEIRNSAAGFAYNGGLIIGAWAPLIAIGMLSSVESAYMSLALAANVIIGSGIILVGSRINPETRNVDLHV